VLAQQGQYGAAVEWRSQIGSTSETSDRRSGLALRLMGTWVLRPGTDGRVEGAWSQMQYDRRDEFGAIPITESGLEVGGLLRQGLGALGSVRPYALLGAIASLRMSCGVDSAFDLGSVVACEGSDQFLLGWGAGLGARREFIGGWDWFLEARVLGNVTSAGGGRLIAIGVGAAF
jgi:hypothetical protein